jgi:hypothetical protein
MHVIIPSREKNSKKKQKKSDLCMHVIIPSREKELLNAEKAREPRVPVAAPLRIWFVSPETTP